MWCIPVLWQLWEWWNLGTHFKKLHNIWELSWWTCIFGYILHSKLKSWKSCWFLHISDGCLKFVTKYHLGKLWHFVSNLSKFHRFFSGENFVQFVLLLGSFRKVNKVSLQMKFQLKFRCFEDFGFNDISKNIKHIDFISVCTACCLSCAKDRSAAERCCRGVVEASCCETKRPQVIAFPKVLRCKRSTKMVTWS